MPSFVPRNMEPYQKRELLDKRWSSLRSAIHLHAGEVRMTSAAEKVRQAALAVIKARRSIHSSRAVVQTLPPNHPDAADVTTELANLQREEERWCSLSIQEIIDMCPDRVESEEGAECHEPS